MSVDDAPIDAVVTWVDGADPVHRARLKAHLATLDRVPVDASETRYRDAGEVDRCLRSLLNFAPFLRRVHVVTDAQVPAILQPGGGLDGPLRERVSVVDHRVVFAGLEHFLPTFNSLSIESVLHRIPGLAERFVYLNDDFMLLRPLQPTDWFRDGRPVLRGQWRLDLGVKDMLHRLRGAPRASYVSAQRRAAKIAGFERRFLLLDHHPHPMRKSVLEAHWAAHRSLWEANASHPLRDAAQFFPPSLAAHLELRTPGVTLLRDPQLLYLKADRLSRRQLHERLVDAQDDPALRFACVQSLDLADEGARAEVLAWLDARLDEALIASPPTPQRAASA